MYNIVQNFLKIFPHWWLVALLVLILIGSLEPKNEDKENK